MNRVGVRTVGLRNRKCAAVLVAFALATATWRAPPATARSYAFITPTWGHLSSPAGWRMHPLGGRWQIHWGIDIASPAGTPVLASAGGIVRHAGSHGAYGLTVVIDHGGSWVTLYGHLARAKVRPGQVVRQAEVIGAVGNTGASTGPHLHFEIRVRGMPVNPLTYLAK